MLFSTLHRQMVCCLELLQLTHLLLFLPRPTITDSHTDTATSDTVANAAAAAVASLGPPASHQDPLYYRSLEEHEAQQEVTTATLGGKGKKKNKGIKMDLSTLHAPSGAEQEERNNQRQEVSRGSCFEDGVLGSVGCFMGVLHTQLASLGGAWCRGSHVQGGTVGVESAVREQG